MISGICFVFDAQGSQIITITSILNVENERTDRFQRGGEKGCIFVCFTEIIPKSKWYKPLLMCSSQKYINRVIFTPQPLYWWLWG